MRTSFFIFTLLFSSVWVFAQTNDPVIMTVNGKNFKKSEFEYFYNKYNNEEIIDKRSLTEYIDLFKNLKLKVVEAETQGMDTTTAFLSELSGYRSTEAKPYLEQLEVDDNFVRKIYNRMKELVEISQITVPFPKVLNNDYTIFPADTLETYKRAIQSNFKAY